MGETKIILRSYSQLSRSNTRRTSINSLHSYSYIPGLTQFWFQESSKLVEEFSTNIISTDFSNTKFSKIIRQIAINNNIIKYLVYKQPQS